MKVIITMPAYNEENSISWVINEINEVMSKTKYNYKIHIQDDGSTDKTKQLAEEAGAIVNSNRTNLGLAETFKAEMHNCLKLGADIIVHTDADGQYPAKYIPNLLKKIEEGYDIVLGSRFISSNKGDTWLKKLGNIAFAKVFANITKIKITDTTTGFRAFTKEIAQKIQFINTFTYTQEQILKAARMKFKIGEIPIKINKTRESRLFKSPFQYAIKAWINIFRIYRDFNPLAFFGKIGLTFFSIGILIGLWILYGFIQTGKVGHLPATILSVLLIILGIQIITFGFLADMRK